ncbi:MAG TPA: hypothetical protein VIS72_13820 [Anaerolineales bacterium]
MSKIVFRGKTYNSVFEMPNDIREAYQIEKRKRPDETNASKPLTEFVEMSDEIRELYERALGNVEKKPASSKPLSDLPSSEDIFRRSAPPEESMYRPSRTPNPPAHQAIEEDNGSRRLALTLVVLMLLAGIAFFVLQNAN